MKRFAIFLSATLVILALLAFAAPTGPAQAATTGQVWVYYMGFWSGPGWDAAAPILSDWPLLGNYDTRDANAAAIQVAQAKGAGIDAFIVDWYGPEDQLTTTPSVWNFLARSSEQGFAAAASIDSFAGYNLTYDQIRASASYALNEFANHPSYLRYNGKPVLYFAFQSNAGLSTAQWQQLRNEVDPNRTSLWFAEGLSGCCLYNGAMDGMWTFNLAWNNGSSARYARENRAVTSRGGIYVPTVHPGWDETLVAQRDGRPNPTSPRARADGAFLRRTWAGATSIRPPIVLIVSWNEYAENNHIEPSQRYGSQALDILAELIPAWKASGVPAAVPTAAPGNSGSTGGNTGGSIPAEILPVGSVTNQFIEPKGRTNVRSGPGTNNAVLGQILAGNRYTVLGRSGNWYAIDYNGQVGWVSFSAVTFFVG